MGRILVCFRQWEPRPNTYCTVGDVFSSLVRRKRFGFRGVVPADRCCNHVLYMAWLETRPSSDHRKVMKKMTQIFIRRHENHRRNYSRLSSRIIQGFITESVEVCLHAYPAHLPFVSWFDFSSLHDETISSPVMHHRQTWHVVVTRFVVLSSELSASAAPSPISSSVSMTNVHRVGEASLQMKSPPFPLRRLAVIEWHIPWSYLHVLKKS